MSLLTTEKIQAIIEAALMIAGEPLTVQTLQNLFIDDEKPTIAEIKALLANLETRYLGSGIEIKEVASGYRLQAKAELSPWLGRLSQDRAPRYSRAFLETLAIIAYKQPITRAEIEDIRGVTVSSNIIKTLIEREWIRLLGHRDVPGKPAIYGTTKAFLDYFSLKSLTDLPTLAEFKDFTADNKVQVELAIEESNIGPSDSRAIPGEDAVILQEIDNALDAAAHQPTRDQSAATASAEENETEPSAINEAAKA